MPKRKKYLLKEELNVTNTTNETSTSSKELNVTNTKTNETCSSIANLLALPQHNDISSSQRSKKILLGQGGSKRKKIFKNSHEFKKYRSSFFKLSKIRTIKSPPNCLKHVVNLLKSYIMPPNEIKSHIKFSDEFKKIEWSKNKTRSLMAQEIIDYINSS